MVTWLTVLFIALFNPLLTEAGFFQNVNNFIKGTGEFIISVNDGLSRVIDGINTVNGVIDDATEEDCVFTCPDGRKPTTRKNHVAMANGCGSFGLLLPDDKLPVTELRKCCDEHDICYDTCNNDKEKCDKEFRRCLFKICEKFRAAIGENMFKGCKTTAQAMYAGTMALGCKAYKDSQKEACDCGWSKRTWNSDL